MTIPTKVREAFAAGGPVRWSFTYDGERYRCYLFGIAVAD